MRRTLTCMLLTCVVALAACAAPSAAAGASRGSGEPFTRELFITRLWEIAGKPACDAPDGFADSAEVSEAARTAVRWAKSNGLLGKIAPGDELFPRRQATSLDCALLLAAYLSWKAGAVPSPQPPEQGGDERKIRVSFGDHSYLATLEDNSSARAFARLLEKGPLTIEARDYGGFEKAADLGCELPRNDESITTAPGDIILYQGNQIAVYYAPNTWSLTRLGRLDDLGDLREALGDGDAAITFSLAKGAEETKGPGGFDFETKTVALNSGYEMPLNGLGTYSLHGDTCVNAVKSALASGVRLFDTASAYGNEEEVGRALREGMEELGVDREEIFVATKIYPGAEMADPEVSIQACLDRLDLGYVDLMLLHHPDENDVKAYRAMEEFVERGLIRSVGLSNWYVEELEEFLPQVETVPAVVQNEIHPYYQENDVIPYVQDLGITMEGWYPLGGRGHTRELLGDEVICSIAEEHGVSAAQVILRWNLQKGVAVIPGSSNPEHILENTRLYDFSLTDEEMARINALDRNEKHDWY